MKHDSHAHGSKWMSNEALKILGLGALINDPNLGFLDVKYHPRDDL